MEGIIFLLTFYCKYFPTSQFFENIFTSCIVFHPGIYYNLFNPLSVFGYSDFPVFYLEGAIINYAEVSKHSMTFPH